MVWPDAERIGDPGIPGQPAPASLKPRRGAGGAQAEGPNTGAACPGLIEAGNTRSRSGATPRIPGQPAPASLKPQGPHEHLAPLPERIPGQPAPASLKQSCRNSDSRVGKVNTGAACPGLIEAPAAQAYETGLAENTGAACPGLIEAASTTSRVSRGNSNTGAACPGLIEALNFSPGLESSFGEYRGSLPRPH